MNTSAQTSVAIAAPQPLPRFNAAARFQAALDADRHYRALVAVALVLAAAAGSGLGTFSVRAGAPSTVLWSLTVAGLLARSVAQRDGLSGQLGRPGALVVLAATPVVAGLFSFGDGLDALRTIGAAAVAAGVLWLVSWRFPMSAWLSAGLVTAAGAALGIWIARTSAGINEGLAAVLGIVIAAASLASTFRSGHGVDSTLAATRLAGLGWALFAWGGVDRGPFNEGLAIAAALVVILLDVWTERRRSFAAIVASAIFLQLGALPPAEELLLGSLWLQPIISASAFAALVLAGWRFVAASLVRQPAVTYRIAPLCVVPRLDRGLDHPVKISVA